MFQTGYSVVSACVVALRWKDKTGSQVSSSAWREGVTCLIAIAICGFGAGVIYRYDASLIFLIFLIVVAIAASAALYFRQVIIISVYGKLQFIFSYWLGYIKIIWIKTIEYNMNLQLYYGCK